MELNKLKAKRSKLKGWMITCLGSCILILGSQTSSEAQTFAEWFSQKKTLIKYLTQQIAALESLEGDVKKGYAIAKGGLGTISGITGAEFGLHQSYFAALKAVNPGVKNDPDLAAITLYVRAIGMDLGALDDLTGLDKDTRSYVRQVSDAVLQDCNKDLDELKPVVSDGQIGMTDEERITKLHEIHAHIKDQYVFTRHFCNAVRVVRQQKLQDAGGIQTLKNVYGIN